MKIFGIQHDRTGKINGRTEWLTDEGTYTCHYTQPCTVHIDQNVVVVVAVAAAAAAAAAVGVVAAAAAAAADAAALFFFSFLQQTNKQFQIVSLTSRKSEKNVCVPMMAYTEGWGVGRSQNRKFGLCTKSTLDRSTKNTLDSHFTISLL